MLKIIKKNKADILVVTPLLTGHKISKKTKKTIKYNDIKYIWASYESDQKHAANVQACIDAYEKEHILPPYIFVLDRDIILSKNHLDNLYDTMISSSFLSDKIVGFVYTPFEYKGYINIKFPPMPYNINNLIKSNYISSNSLYVTECIKKVGGFVTEERYNRLSDWAMWLKMFSFGYQGVLCKEGYFTAMSTKDDISCGGDDEYIRTMERIVKDFVYPLLQ